MLCVWHWPGTASSWNFKLQRAGSGCGPCLLSTRPAMAREEGRAFREVLSLAHGHTAKEEDSY